MPKAIGGVDIADPENDAPAPVVEDLAGLVALVQMDVLEIHPGVRGSTRSSSPTAITFDLDPDEGLPWPRVIEAALEVREALAGIGLQSFVKTTGGKGLHVVVPLTPKLDWDAVKAFARWVAERLAEQRPERFTANRAKRARHGRIYIDYLRNGRGATAVGAYSPRAAARRAGVDAAVLGRGRAGRAARRPSPSPTVPGAPRRARNPTRGRRSASCASRSAPRCGGGSASDRRTAFCAVCRSADAPLTLPGCGTRPVVASFNFATVTRWRRGNMPRASWNGFLRLSLVTCPVYLVPATTEAKRIRLNQLNSETGNRVAQQLVDSKTGETVERDQIVKGYEYDRGRYVDDHR